MAEHVGDLEHLVRDHYQGPGQPMSVGSRRV